MSADNMYDVIVIGGGPAGLTAGMYLARARYRVLVLEKGDFGGAITITAEVVNYPGVLNTDGAKLTGTMRQQAIDFGAELKVADATGIEVSPDDDGAVKTVHTSAGDFRAFGIVLAMGAAPRHVGFEGESEYAGRGVAYCATCDGEFYTGREVLVIGGGYAAAEEAVFLTRFASKVTMLVREPDFTCAANVAQKAKDDPKIDIRYNTELLKVTAGNAGLSSALIRDDKTGETYEWKPADGATFGVFVFAGYAPQTGLVKNLVELDGNGYVVTSPTLETNVPGIYAAGDLREKPLRQVVTATADGALAATELERYAASASKRTGIVPERPTGTNYQNREAIERNSAPANTTAAPAPARAGDTEQAFRFDDAVRQQLDMVFGRMAQPVTLELTLDDSPLSVQLETFMDELASVSGGKVAVRTKRGHDLDAQGRGAYDPAEPLPQATPMVRIMTLDDMGELKPSGLAFHGVPSGHEFNSFVLGMYNAAGPGQPISDEEAARIGAIADPVDVMLLVSLTCTMCPESVRAAQRIAALNGNVRAEAYDVAHFPALKEQYEVTSVPMIVINRNGNQLIEFGRKGVSQMLDAIDRAAGESS